MKARNTHIDVLRGLSIWVVLFTHFGVCAPFSRSILPAGLVAQASHNGYYGVSAFFVISGFLITTMALRREGGLARLHPGEFYVFRIARIIPPLVLLVGLNVAGMAGGLGPFQLAGGITLGRLLASVFTFRFNLLYVHGGSLLLPWAPLWSLAIEEVFYLLFPLLCRLGRHTAVMAVLLGGIGASGPWYRHAHGPDSLYAYLGCFDLLALGCLTALVARGSVVKGLRPGLRAALRAGALAGLALLYFAINVHDAFGWIFGPSLVGLLAAVFLLGSGEAAGTAAVKRPVWPVLALAWMGCLSYELYLYHLPLYLLIRPVLQAYHETAAGWFPRDLFSLLMAAALTAICAAISAWYSEPARRAIRRMLA